MVAKKLEFLREMYPEYRVDIIDNGLRAVIRNPFYNEHLHVSYYEEDDFTPFVASFSFQHCHLSDEEDVIEWINDVINGRIVSIEFFRNGQRRFGGDIEAKELIDLSYQKLEQYSGYWGITKLFQIADSFKVRGWHRENNFDAEFVLNQGETIVIKTKCDR